MKEEFKKSMLKRAFFVGGSDGYFRDKNDPITQSALDDAEKLISQLPEKYQEPDIGGGSTAMPSTIVSMSWRNFSVGIFRVAIDFKGNEEFVVHWSNPDRTRSRKDVHSMDELKNMDIPQMVENLKNIRPAMPGEPPLG